MKPRILCVLLKDFAEMMVSIKSQFKFVFVFFGDANKWFSRFAYLWQQNNISLVSFKFLHQVSRKKSKSYERRLSI